MSAPLVAKRMPGRRGASEQNSSRGPAMHPTAGLNPPNTFADLTVGCALSGRPAPAIGWQVPCTCGPRPRPVLRVTSIFIRAPSLASLLASLKHLHAHVHGERPPSRGVPCQVSPIAQYAVSWRMLTRDKLRGQAGQWSPTRSVGRRQSQRPQADQGSLQDLEPLVGFGRGFGWRGGSVHHAGRQLPVRAAEAVRPALVVPDPTFQNGWPASTRFHQDGCELENDPDDRPEHL